MTRKQALRQAAAGAKRRARRLPIIHLDPTAILDLTPGGIIWTTDAEMLNPHTVRVWTKPDNAPFKWASDLGAGWNVD